MAKAEPAPTARRSPQMATNVPTELLRSFVAIVDGGSMARATETIFLSQSALSLQMKRLEDLLQQRVFHRTGRSLLLTAAGEELASLARQMLGVNDRIVATLGHGGEPAPLQLGLVPDFADTILPGVLACFAALHPETRLQLKVDGSAELLELFDRSKLDLVMGLGRHGALRRSTSRIIADVPMAWIGDPALLDRDALPLVLLDHPCAFRTAMLEAIEAQGLPYRIVLETPTLPGLKAALRAGLGITCRTADYAASEALPVLTDASLPDLPRIDYVLHCRRPAATAVDDLAGLIEQAVYASGDRRSHLAVVPRQEPD